LALEDHRHPITIAFEHYVKSGATTAEQRERWIEELTQAVEEGARKFVGFNNVNTMKKALDINLGLLSLGLLLKVGGSQDVKMWVEVLEKSTIKDLLKEALVALKGLAYSESYLFPEMGERPVREVMLTVAQARERARKTVWNGWREFLQERANRRSQQGSDQLARHLIQTLTGSEPESWMQRANREHSENAGLASAEETINTLVLRHCILRPGEKFPEDIYVSSEYLKRIRLDYENNPDAWIKRVRARYDELLGGLREKLTGVNWWDSHLKNGPPKLAKRPAKKKQTDEIDEDDPVEIEGVSGIYLCRIY
jgi:hypothetical protein